MEKPIYFPNISFAYLSLSLKILYSQCIEAINDIFANFEIIFIDDGSFDNSFDILKNI